MIKKYGITVGVFGLGLSLIVLVILLRNYTKLEGIENPGYLPDLPLNSQANGSDNERHVGDLGEANKSVSDNMSVDRRTQAYNCIKYIEEQEKSGKSVGDAPDERMVSRDSLIKNAFQKARSTSNVKQAPSIVLIDNIYIVSLWRHSNPFRAGDPGYDLRLGFDAWTGEYIMGLRGGGGIRVLNVSRKNTGAGKVGESPEAEQYYKRTFEALEKLELNIFYGRPWPDEPTVEMIASSKAEEVARQQVKNRVYDQSKEPLTLLIDDLYLVTFWDRDIDKLPEGSNAFDSRVGIDAYTGEFIAMETTRKRRPPVGKDVEE